MKDDWATPQALFDKLNGEFHFTLDVCALPVNAKCRRYFSPADDGLSQSWTGETCWMNPPFGKAIEGWLKKAAAAQSVVVALVPTRTNAPWWHDYVMHAAEIRFIRKKVSFVGDKNGVAFTGHALVVFRPGRHELKCTSWDQPVKAIRRAA
jgi:phage N-6-adenine-methyltransferase